MKKTRFKRLARRGPLLDLLGAEVVVRGEVLDRLTGVDALCDDAGVFGFSRPTTQERSVAVATLR